MSKEECRDVKCNHCLEDPCCCTGVYHPLIDDSLCNTCVNASSCYEVFMAVDACSEYLPDVPLAALAPRHISTYRSCTLPPSPPDERSEK